jgi:hypothetical protein
VLGNTCHPRNVDLLPYKPVIGESSRFVILVPFLLMNLRNNWGERLQYGVTKADEYGVTKADES